MIIASKAWSKYEVEPLIIAEIDREASAIKQLFLLENYFHNFSFLESYKLKHIVFIDNSLRYNLLT